MIKISFKSKLFLLVVAIISVTIATSYFSSNYYINNYIHTEYTNNIKNKIELVRQMLNSKLESDIKLAEASNFNFVEIKETLDKTGFSDIVQITYGIIYSDEGTLISKEDKEKYGGILAAANGKTTLGDVFYLNEKPQVTITVPENARDGNIFYVDLSPVQNMLSNTSGNGYYFELTDSNKNIIFSNEKGTDLDAIKTPFEVAGKEWVLTGYIDRNFIQENVNRLNRSITLALLILSSIVIPVSIFLIHKSFTPIVKLRELVTELSNGNGDLTQRLKVELKDDLGMIAHGINQFIQSLQKIMLEVSTSGEQITGEVSQLQQQAGSNQDLLQKHSSEMALAVESMSEMNSSASSVAENAAITARQTREADAEAEQSKAIVQQVVDQVEILVDQVEHTSASIVAMSKDTEQISAVLNVIGEIAEQTNLLALNAAIEAARAGEQGRGFAVVADEVRALAARTQNSTEEVNQMLTKLTAGNTKVVSSIETTKSSCHKTAATAAQVMSSLNSMTDAVSNVADHIVQIAAAAEEQSSVTAEINKNVSAIQNVVQTLNQNGESTVTSTHHLTETNNMLMGIVNQFKL